LQPRPKIDPPQGGGGTLRSGKSKRFSDYVLKEVAGAFQVRRGNEVYYTAESYFIYLVKGRRSKHFDTGERNALKVHHEKKLLEIS